MKWHTTHIQQPLTPQSICLHAPMQYIFNSSRVKSLNHTMKYNNLDTAVVCAKQLHQQAICNDNCFARITQLDDNDTEPRLKFNAKSVPGCHSHSNLKRHTLVECVSGLPVKRQLLLPQFRRYKKTHSISARPPWHKHPTLVIPMHWFSKIWLQWYIESKIMNMNDNVL